jgi:hypothetical protein
MNRTIVVVDDFYPDPDAVRRKAFDLSFSEPENYVGWRTRSYHPRGVRERIERRFRLRVTDWIDDADDLASGNGVFFTAYSRGRRAETVGVHYDTPLDWLMMIVYLTPDAPFESGTSFWQHRKTGLTAAPGRKDAARLGRTVAELERVLERDSKTPGAWREIDRIGNVYNRAVLFPGGRLHSATRHFGNALSNGRLYQTFHFAARE